MTAPEYNDAHEVKGVTKQILQDMADPNSFTRESVVATAALALWDARDSARQTAALQDAAIHKTQGRLWALTKLRQAIVSFQERGYESGFKEMNEAITAANKALK